ncbi:MAG: hypothetical protein ACLR4A_18915 [Christensenellales bacterium]
MAHQSKVQRKRGIRPRRRASPTRAKTWPARRNAGLTPTEPEDLEEAYALGELYAVHTLRPNERQPSQ